MEREHGSLITALQSKPKPATHQPIFTSLRNGMSSLTAALIAKLPAERISLNSPAFSLKREGKLWCVRHNTPAERGIPGKTKKHFKQVLLATSLDPTRSFLERINPTAAALLPAEASSAILAAFTWPADLAGQFTIPPGFGFLVPPAKTEADASQLLAATFVDQKFSHRGPSNTRILRAFFGGKAAAHFAEAPDDQVAEAALSQLRAILGPIPDPPHTEIRRWPRSLPQYEVGHLDRIAQLDDLMHQLPSLHLLGNSYRGVGLPDLIHAARTTARKIVSELAPR